MFVDAWNQSKWADPIQLFLKGWRGLQVVLMYVSVVFGVAKYGGG